MLFFPQADTISWGLNDTAVRQFNDSPFNHEITPPFMETGFGRWSWQLDSSPPLSFHGVCSFSDWCTALCYHADVYLGKSYIQPPLKFVPAVWRRWPQTKWRRFNIKSCFWADSHPWHKTKGFQAVEKQYFFITSPFWNAPWCAESTIIVKSVKY